MKIVEEKIEKAFTKNMGKDIIEENHNPLKVNYKNLFERDEIIMEKVDKVILNEEENTLMEERNKSKNLIRILKRICNDFKIYDYKKEINEFLKKYENLAIF